MNIRDKVLAQVKKNITKYNMVNNGDVVCVGLSGGADSVTLLHVLYTLQSELNFSLIAAHINHGIREEAKNDADFCSALCNSLSIPFYLKEVKIKELAKVNHLGEEEMGRQVRYGFFNELVGKGKIATAHNKNDNVETIFMRLIRGTGLNGLGGINYVNGNIIRPLLNISRSDIEEYVEFCNLKYVTDKTNFQPIYTRNKIRLDIIPYIQKNINNNVVDTIGDNIEQYKEDNDCLLEIANDFFNANAKMENQRVSLNIEKLKSQHIAIQKRVIIIAIQKVKKIYQDVADSKNVETIIELMNKGNGKSFEFNKMYCFVENGYLVFAEQKMESKKYNISISKCTMSKEIENNELICYIPDYLFDENKLEIRTRRNGDIVRIDDNKHKKLTDLLSDKKIPAELRKNIQVISLNNEIIMIPGVFSTRYSNRTGNFIRIEIN